MTEKHTVTPQLGITAEQCRQNAMVCANTAHTSHFPTETATIGIMWAMIGQLCCALGDPDSPNKANDYSVTVNIDPTVDSLAELRREGLQGKPTMIPYTTLVIAQAQIGRASCRERV